MGVARIDEQGLGLEVKVFGIFPFEKRPLGLEDEKEFVGEGDKSASGPVLEGDRSRVDVVFDTIYRFVPCREADELMGSSESGVMSAVDVPTHHSRSVSRSGVIGQYLVACLYRYPFPELGPAFIRSPASVSQITTTQRCSRTDVQQTRLSRVRRSSPGASPRLVRPRVGRRCLRPRVPRRGPPDTRGRPRAWS